MQALTADFDATLWDEPLTGIGLHTHRLAQALSERGVRLRRLGARVSGEAPRGSVGRTLWTLATLPRLLGASALFHAVGNFNLPLQKGPGQRFVLTVHDVIPLTHPTSVSRAFHWQFRLWLTRSLLIADRVLCVSAHTERELLRLFPWVEGRTLVVHNGADHLLDAPPVEEVEAAYVESLALPERFLLYAGSLDVRKNVALVLEALEQLGPTFPLVLVGQGWFGSGPVERKLAELRERGFDLRPLGHQPQGVYREVMRRASVFVFPSRAEGFGLPPLEAMSQGVPVIVSNAGSLPEVCGAAALSVDPDDARGLASLVSTLWTSRSERMRLTEAGRQQVQRFTWARAAAETERVYRELVPDAARA